MGKSDASLIAAEVVLLGAYDLVRQGQSEFSEWDLTVSAWKRDENRFGCRGYEAEHPDHKRVMMEMIGTKKSGPRGQGWIDKVRANTFTLTRAGRVAAEEIDGRAAGTTRGSVQALYQEVVRLTGNRAYKRHLADPEEPRLWNGVAAFLELSSNDADEVRRKLLGTRAVIDRALQWFAETEERGMRSGPTAGAKTVTRDDVERLERFVVLLRKRFARDFEQLELD